MTVGIPRALFYYLDKDIVVPFLKKLSIDVKISSKTNKQIIEQGMKYASDEMCLSLKNYIGHVFSLIDDCDFILVPRIDNYGLMNQTCTNFIAAYDLINNLFNTKVLEYNIDLNNKQTLKKGLFKIGKFLKKSDFDIKNAYYYAVNNYKKVQKQLINNNLEKLNSDQSKILLISHSYNSYDDIIGKPLVDMIKKQGIEVIYADRFDKSLCLKLSKNISKDLYWKYSKELIGAYEIAKDKINGVVFLSTFPCGLDSLANELLIRKLKLPYLNVVVDEMYGETGLETRVESFSDIINNYK